MDTDATEGMAGRQAAGSTSSSPFEPMPEVTADGAKPMAAVLHKAGKRTAGMSDAEISRAYHEHRERLDRDRREANEQRRREFEAKQRAGLAEAHAFAQERQRTRIARLRTKLEAQGIRAADLDDDGVVRKHDELQRQAERQAERERVRRRADTLFRATAVPPRHAMHLYAIEPEDNPEWHKVRELLIERSGEGFLVALLGIRGTGKTQLAVSAIRHACEQERTCRCLKRTWGASSASRHQRDAARPRSRGEGRSGF